MGEARQTQHLIGERSRLADRLEVVLAQTGEHRDGEQLGPRYTAVLGTLCYTWTAASNLARPPDACTLTKAGRR